MSFDLYFGSSLNGAMAATNTIRSAWIKLNKDVSFVAFSTLWTGDPTGTFSLEGKIGDKRTFDLDSEFVDGANPDGTSYSGSLSASDLDAEDLGEAFIRANNVTAEYVRLKYINSAGTGTLNVMFDFKTGDGELNSISATLTASDIQIGAVEIKNATTDDRANVSDANTARTIATHVIPTQHIDATGKVPPAGEVVGNAKHVRDDTHFGAVGAAADVDGIVHGQLRYIGEAALAMQTVLENIVTVKPGTIGTGYKYYTGSGTPATLDFNTDLGRNAQDGYLANTGVAAFTFTINQGSGAGDSITLNSGDVFSLEGLNIDTVVITNAGASTYQCFVI